MPSTPKHNINATKRDLSQNLRQLRAGGILPGNVFEAHKPSIAISLDLIEFKKLYSEIGESGVGYIQLSKSQQLPAMIEEVQVNSVTDEPIHVIFQVVDLSEKVRADIPVELIGEFELPEAVLVTVKDEIEVEALPTNLPEKFVINVEQLTAIGQSITLADLEYDRDKVEIILGDEGLEEAVILVQEVEEEPEEPEEPIETEIIGEDEEGEEAEEGEAGEDEKEADKDEKEGEEEK
jgi:large subunit ribosomal protein L25